MRIWGGALSRDFTLLDCTTDLGINLLEPNSQNRTKSAHRDADLRRVPRPTSRMEAGFHHGLLAIASELSLKPGNLLDAA